MDRGEIADLMYKNQTKGHLQPKILLFFVISRNNRIFVPKMKKS